MNITKIELSNYRNYENVSLDNLLRLNVISGDNATGKTNFVESIVLASLGRSLRSSKDKELIRWGADEAYIKITGEKRGKKHVVEISLTAKEKRIAVNRLPVTKISALMGELPIVYFCPDELRLIKDAPSDRRRFIDISLCQQSKIYYKTLSNYNDILSQRNQLLKSASRRETLLETLPLWNKKLAGIAAKLVLDRINFVKLLRVYALEKHVFLTGDLERLSVEYERETVAEDFFELEKEYLEIYEKNLNKDLDLHYTSAGPHRDDIKFSINGVDVRKYGSQGQQRTTALALKLAEAHIFELNTGEKPILILDDVMSELDDNRLQNLLLAVKDIQTFITCTDFRIKETSGIRRLITTADEQGKSVIATKL